LYIQAADHRGNGGLCFVVNRTKVPSVLVKRINHRTMSMTFESAQISYFILNTHAPHAGHPQQQVEHMDELQSIMMGQRQACQLILGDLNAPLHTLDGRPATGAAADQLRTFLSSTNMCAVSVAQPTSRKFTFEFPSHGQKELDHILIGRRFVSALRRHKITHATIPTGHLMVSAMVHFKWSTTSGRVRKIRPWFQLQQPAQASRYVAAFHRCMDTVQTHSDTTPPTHAQTVNRSVIRFNKGLETDDDGEEVDPASFDTPAALSILVQASAPLKTEDDTLPQAYVVALETESLSSNIFSNEQWRLHRGIL
jgi:hypothetical protein